MKLRELEIKAFRGFLDTPVFSLDGDIILLAGSNGLGKTTFFDAFEWCLTGRLKRYEQSPTEKWQYPYIVNRFATRDAFVRVSFIDGENVIEFIREGDEHRTKFNIRVNGETIPATQVKGKKLEVLIADEELLEQIQEEDIESLLLRSHLLEQELTAEFVRSVSPTSRFSQLSKILGADRFEGFYRKISRSYKFIDEELSSHEIELRRLSGQLHEMQVSLKTNEQWTGKFEDTMSKEAILDQCKKIFELLRINLPNTPIIHEEWLKFGLVEFCNVVEDYCKAFLGNAERLMEEIGIKRAQLSTIQQDYYDIDQIIEATPGKKKSLENLAKGKVGVFKERTVLVNRLKTLEEEQNYLEESIKKFKVRASDLEFFHKNLARYEADKKEIDDLTSALDKTREMINSKLKSIETLKHENEIAWSSIEKYGGENARLANDLKKWTTTKEKYEQLREITRRSETVQNDVNRLHRMFTEQSETIMRIEADLAKKEEEHREAMRRCDELSQRVSQYVELIGRLRAFIDTATCPLCGYDWKSKELLLKQVDKISGEESELISLQKRKLLTIGKEASDLRKQLQEKQAAALSLSDKLELHTKELKDLNRSEEELTSMMHRLGITKQELLSMQKEFIEQQLDETKRKMDFVDQKIVEIKKDLNKKLEILTKFSGELNALEITRETKTKMIENVKAFGEEFQRKINEFGISQENLINVSTLYEDTRREIGGLNEELIKIANERESIIAKIKEVDQRIDQLEEERRVAEEQLAIWEQRIQEFVAKLRKFELAKHSQITDKLQNFISTENGITKGIRDLKKLLEAINTLRGKERYEALSREIQKLKKEVGILNDKTEGIRGSRRLAERLNEAARRETRNVILNLIKAHEPLINDFYQQVSPHPRFRSIQFVPKAIPGRGGGNALFIEAIDEFEGKRINPSLTFSSAQLNVLAISIFLAIHTKQAWSKLDTILMDDPIQNMDDLNILSYIDLIRRIRRDKQIVISTHDENIYRLMRRKFEPSDGETLICYEYKTYRVNGPEIEVHRMGIGGGQGLTLNKKLST